jgi:hypothetical protein
MATGGLMRGGGAVGAAFRQGVGETFGFEYQGGKNMGFLGRKMKGGIMSGGKFGLGLKLLGPVALGFSAYQGYSQGGLGGAAWEVTKEAAVWGALRAGWHLGKAAILNPVTLTAAAAAGLGYAAYKFGEASQRHVKRLRNVEMGGEIMDRFGTVATMRQRSLSAIQNTHVNGRIALGNEAILTHTPFMRSF